MTVTSDLMRKFRDNTSSKLTKPVNYIYRNRNLVFFKKENLSSNDTKIFPMD